MHVCMHQSWRPTSGIRKIRLPHPDYNGLWVLLVFSKVYTFRGAGAMEAAGSAASVAQLVRGKHGEARGQEIALLQKLHFKTRVLLTSNPADRTVSKRPGTSNRIEIHFAVFNHLYLCFSFIKLAETL